MTRPLRPTALALALLSVVSPARVASAQAAKAAERPSARDTGPFVASISPPSAVLGTSTEWTITGRNLAKVDRLVLSGAGLTVTNIRPQSDNQATATVLVADSAEPGFREVRAMGPHGASNLALVRLDRLPQAAEAEPNDEPRQAGEIKQGSAVVGVLKPQDIDHYKLAAKAGQRLTIEVEAQRLGTPIVPVLTVMSEAGTPMVQATETRGVDHDSRLTYAFPADGTYLLQVRDTVYGGGDSAIYRLRVLDEPYASGVFPLGGPRGQTLAVTATGGNLAGPLSKSITLPDTPGEVVEVGPFEGPGGPVLAPMRLIVGDGPEVTEGPEGSSPMTVPQGTTANGRIGRPGEVDRWVVPVKKGDRLEIRVRAEGLGSWLDSVVTLLDAKGAVLAEQDDLVPNGDMQQQQAQLVNPNAPPTLAPDASDSRLDFEAKEDGELTIEVADRFSEGGPEYGYRLEVGPERPDFRILLLLDPNINQRAQVVNGRRARGNAPGITGAVNLKPGASVSVNYLVTAEGDTGEIEITAEGLPEGVSARPAKFKPSGGGRRARNQAQPGGGVVVLQAAPNAEPAAAEIRIVGRTTDPKRPKLVRVATGTLNLDTNATATASRAVTRPISNLALRVLGDLKPPSLDLAGPPRPVDLDVKEVKVPGPLLQGETIELALLFDPPRLPSSGVTIEATSTDRHLAFQIPEPEPGAKQAMLRVIAGEATTPGKKEVALRVVANGGAPIERIVALEVRPPIAVKVKDGPIVLDKAGRAKVWVGVEREPGFKGQVDLEIHDLPRGVQVVRSTTHLTPRQDGREVSLALARGAKPPVGPVALRITAIARVRRGKVPVDSPIRPMLMGPSADKD